MKATEPKEVFSIKYYSERGRCFVLELTDPGQSRPFIVYFQDQGREPRVFESQPTLQRAESCARWMAMGS